MRCLDLFATMEGCRWNAESEGKNESVRRRGRVQRLMVDLGWKEEGSSASIKSRSEACTKL